MKTFDFKQYNEKLKINPIALEEFDKVGDMINMMNHITKQDLVTCDIVKLYDGLYMIFTENDMMKELIKLYGEDMIKQSGGIFFYSRINKKNEFIQNHMPFNLYNDNLECESEYMNDVTSARWDVKTVYKRMNNFPRPTKKEEITQEYLENLIKKYKFLKIELDHENN